MAAAWAVLGVGTASATDLSTAIPLPEASELLGWYGNFSNGRDWISDFSLCFDPAGDNGRDCSVDTKFGEKPVLDHGLIFEASLGYAFSSGFRLEGEFSHRRDALDDLLGADAQLTSDEAHADQLALLLNGAYDFDTHSPLTPFIGAGLGGVRVQYDDPALLGDDLDFSTEESAWKLGVQGFAGLQYEFTPDLRLGVRYTHKLVSNMGDSFDSAAAVGSPESNSLRSRVFMLTLTYEFGGP
jgi:opacity protein-like surface antigen